MVSQDLVRYLREGIAGGHSIESLKSELIKSGWSSSEVDVAARKVQSNSSPALNSVSLEKTHSKNRKKVYLVILGIVVLAVVGYFVLYSQSYKVTLVSSMQISECENTTNGYFNNQELCYRDFALSQDDISVLDCQNMELRNKSLYDDREHRVTCYTEIARVKKDLSICDFMYSELGESYLSYVERCYIAVAEARQDIFICVTMMDRYTDNEHYIIGQCVSAVAGSKQDISICSSYLDGINKDICIKSVAESQENLLVCDEIKTEIRFKEQCIATIAGLKEDLSICESMQSQSSSRQRCFQNVAIAKGDLSICAMKIQDELYIPYCAEQVAIKQKDIVACDIFEDARFKTSCIEGVAYGSFNEEYCDFLEDEDVEHCKQVVRDRYKTVNF